MKTRMSGLLCCFDGVSSLLLMLICFGHYRYILLLLLLFFNHYISKIKLTVNCYRRNLLFWMMMLISHVLLLVETAGYTQYK